LSLDAALHATHAVPAPKGSLFEKILCQPPSKPGEIPILSECRCFWIISFNTEHMHSPSSRQRVVAATESCSLVCQHATPPVRGPEPQSNTRHENGHVLRSPPRFPGSNGSWSLKAFQPRWNSYRVAAGPIHPESLPPHKKPRSESIYFCCFAHLCSSWPPVLGTWYSLTHGLEDVYLG
jgi:hypothetical protein